MIIPNKENLKSFGQEVYTDGGLVYKFYADYHERHPDLEVEALKKVKDIYGTQQFVNYDAEKKILVTRLADGYLLD